MPNPKFTVDTHLFRELGELLVGRDSTALVELIKNSYDADATHITVHGKHLDDPRNGRIVISDDGVGMTAQQFNDGFLRIASRLKEVGERRSSRFKRRFTGAKGIGRLAAHKLASQLAIDSIPAVSAGNLPDIVKAAIDWDAVEARATLDDLEGSGAITLETYPRSKKVQSGTTITMQTLRRRWTSRERANFLGEVETFNPPQQLVELNTLPKGELLFHRAHVRDTGSKDPGCNVELLGEFESGEDYWQALAQAAQWVLEIDARSDTEEVAVNVVPTPQGRKEFADAERGRFSFAHPSPSEGPFFQARILIREGVRGKTPQERAWHGRASGVRVYMEGFRVLPYGEANDDWLWIDADYNKRQKSLQFLPEFDIPVSEDREEGLLRIPKSAYFGAVFLTQSQAPDLRMLVNREGFVPDASFLRLTDIIRTGINLSIRQRAAAKRETRDERTETRRAQSARAAQPARLELRHAVELSVQRASDYALEARKLAAAGDIESARKFIDQAASEFSSGASTSDRLISEGSILRILASVGTQMAAFVHEVHQLLGAATALERVVEKLREDPTLSVKQRSQLGKLHAGLGDLRRVVERQASYLTDVTSADSRRRRSRQRFADRFEAARRLVQSSADAREIDINNEISPDLRSPPMFPAEVTLVLSNLLTNAVKAAGKRGKVRAKSRLDAEGNTHIIVENTGVAVNLKDAERWFRPFESTSATTDPVLGQGMGLGLPITRNMLGDYGATIQFVKPSGGYATALEMIFSP